MVHKLEQLGQLSVVGLEPVAGVTGVLTQNAVTEIDVGKGCSEGRLDIVRFRGDVIDEYDDGIHSGSLELLDGISHQRPEVEVIGCRHSFQKLFREYGNVHISLGPEGELQRMLWRTSRGRRAC